MNDAHLFPVTAATIQIVQSQQLVLLRLDFLTHAMQSIAEANQGRNYALTLEQARQVVQSLSAAIRQLETGGEQPPPGPKQ